MLSFTCFPVTSRLSFSSVRKNGARAFLFSFSLCVCMCFLFAKEYGTLHACFTATAAGRRTFFYVLTRRSNSGINCVNREEIMDDYFFQCKNDKTRIFDLICGCRAVPTIAHHAMIVAHQLLRFDMALPPPLDVAKACLMFARKERNRHGGTGQLAETANDANVVAIELFLVQNMRRKTVLVESCLRIALKELVDSNRDLREYAEDIVTVALCLVEEIYREPYCLAPDSAARACMLQACQLLDFTVVIPQDTRFGDAAVLEIQLFLQMRHGAN